MMNLMRGAAAALALAGLGFISTNGATRSAAAQTAVSVTVDAAAGLGAIPNSAWGVNAAAWDGNLLNAAVPGLLSKAGVTALRYPGGSIADAYNWQSNSIVPGQRGGTNPGSGFDAFMGLTKNVGATPIITVNYGSNATGSGGGDPAFAASWVRYANIVKGYGVKYWEIGNEIYGNGEYGAAWETDLHAAHDPTTYGKNVALFAAAMKAVDPSIKIGAVLTAPGSWPDGQSPDWNTNVLSQCGGAIDFVTVHWYPQNPGGESDSALLAAPQDAASGIAAMATKLKALISQFGGANAANIQILLTETNSVTSNPGKQTLSIVNALFIADDLLTWLENGVTNVDLWDLHNGANPGNASPGLYGSASFGDYGVLSNGSSGEPAADTPFPTYYGLQILSKLGRPGDALVSTSSNSSLLATHAVQQANGNLALLFINKDPSNTINANVSLSGFKPFGVGAVYSYTPSSSGVSSTSVSGLGTTFTITAPPYSLTTIVLAGPLSPSPSFALSAFPTSLSIAQGEAGAATISVTPSGGFSSSVALSAIGLPDAVRAAFSPPSTTTGSSTLTLSMGASAPVGTSVFTIIGTSGALSASTALALTVSASTAPGNGPATFTGKASTNGPWFDEDDVVLSTTAPITALTLTITVPATDVTFSGVYNTFGSQIVNANRGSTNLAYSFTLSPGQTIGPGAGNFAAQMKGNGATHDVTADSWSVTYSSGGATYTQSGKFN
jgi:hypothetical protein